MSLVGITLWLAACLVKWKCNLQRRMPWSASAIMGVANLASQRAALGQEQLNCALGA